MLESLSDFKYTDIDDVEEIVAPGGEVGDPLPKRVGVAVPFGGSIPSGLDGNLMLLDVAWLKEACQERETLITGVVPGSSHEQTVTPRVYSSELVSVASVLKAWASRWEAECPSGIWCRPGIFNEFTSWTAIGGATITWKYSDRWSDQFAIVPSQLSGWRDSIDRDDPDSGSASSGDEFSWAKKAKKVFVPYALRDYAGIASFLGEEPDDDPGEGRFAWKGVYDWTGEYPPAVICLHVLELFSDLEKTVVGAVSEVSATATVKSKSHTDTNSTTEYSGSYKSHGDCSDGCGTFHQGEARAPGSSNWETNSETSRSVTVAPGDMCACPDDADVTTTGSSVGLFGKSEYEQTCKWVNRGWTLCHDSDCVTTDQSPYDFWTEKGDEKSRGEYEESSDTEVEFDLSGRIGDDVTIDKAAIVMFAVSVDVKAEKQRNDILFVDANLNGREGRNYSGRGECRFTVSVKVVECEVDGGVVKVPAVDSNDIPEASGGREVELGLPEGSDTPPQGTQKSPYVREETTEYKGKRRTVHAFGPLFVKFVPKTLVEEPA